MKIKSIIFNHHDHRKLVALKIRNMIKNKYDWIYLEFNQEGP